MRPEGRPESTNVEDRRGQRMRGGPALGCGGLILVLAVSLLHGTGPSHPLQLLSSVQEETALQEPALRAPAPKDQLGTFARTVLADTETTWKGIFADAGRTYEEPPLVLFTEAVRSGCGNGVLGHGAFYCPADHKVYLDPVFFDQLSKRFGAPGDFAQAYVIAHEVGPPASRTSWEFPNR